MHTDLSEDESGYELHVLFQTLFSSVNAMVSADARISFKVLEFTSRCGPGKHLNNCFKSNSATWCLECIMQLKHLGLLFKI